MHGLRLPGRRFWGLLGGSWVVISGIRSPLIWVITIVILLITLHITSHERRSRGLGFKIRILG